MSQVLTAMPGTRLNMKNILVTNAYPLKEITSPAYTGCILNVIFMDNTTGLNVCKADEYYNNIYLTVISVQ
jgi:hypothetical protein